MPWYGWIVFVAWLVFVNRHLAVQRDRARDQLAIVEKELRETRLSLTQADALIGSQDAALRAASAFAATQDKRTKADMRDAS